MGAFTYSAACSVLRLLFGYSTRVTVDFSNDLPRGPFLFAPNHISHFDPPLLSAYLPFKIDWMADVELFRHPVGKLLFNALNTFPVDRNKPDRASLKGALDRLAAGRNVGLFPDGGIRHAETSILGGAAPKPGVAAIAAMAKVPVVPGIVMGTDRLYDKVHWKRWRKVPVWIAVGSPISVPTEGGKEARREFEEIFANALRKLGEKVTQERGLREEDLPASPQARMQGYGRMA